VGDSWIELSGHPSPSRGWTVIGECYVYGIMFGEVLDKPNAKFEKFIFLDRVAS
jgi:hypothetical protein